MEKIFGYVRESTMQQAMFGYNIEEQKRVIEEYCKYHYQDYELELFIEKGKSATTMNRPELKSLLETVKKSKADKVVFHSLDRLTRDIRDLYTLIEFFDKNNIEVVSVMESLDLKTAIGRSHVYNSGVYAQLESERISERTIRALQQGVYEGKYPFSSCPIGYEKIDKRLYPSNDENQIKIIKFIFSTIASGEFNITELVLELRSRYNCKMDDIRLKKLIQNKIYIGIMDYRGIVNEHYCQPLISEDIFYKANESIKVKRKSRKNMNYLFKNMVWCANCKSPMTQGSGTSRHKKSYSYYICPKCGKRASQCKITELKQAELQGITDLYFKDEKGYTEKKKSIKSLRRKQRNLVTNQKAHRIDVNDFYEIYISYDDEINELQLQLEKIETNKSSFEYLDHKFQKDIIHKYIKEVKVNFTGRKYSVTLVRNQ